MTGRSVRARRVGTAARRRAAEPLSLNRLRLVVCGIAFVLLTALKLLLPEAMQDVRATLGTWLARDADFREAFSAVGRAVSGESSALEDAYIAVFGGTAVQAPNGAGTAVQAPNGAGTAARAPGGAEQTPGAAVETLGAAAPASALPDAADYPAHAVAEQRVLGFAHAAPLAGRVTSPFGWRVHPGTGAEAFHYGVDIAAEEGSDIAAFADGVVGVVAESVELGKYLTVHHGDVLTLYAHCSRISVRSGDEVRCGGKLAEVGQTGNATGPHLHFELRDGEDWLDPQYYL